MARYKLNKLFSVVFFAVFSGLLILIINNGYVNEKDRNTYNCTPFERECIIASFLLFTFVMIVFYFIYNRISDRSRFIGKADKAVYVPLIIFTVCALMFVLQLGAGFLLACNPVTDVKILNGFSLDFAKNGNFNLVKSGYMDHYLVKYQNNFAVYFLLSALYRLSYTLTGRISVYLPIMLNALAINISVMLTVFLSRKLLGDRKALFTLFLCVIFAPFYTYAAFYYSDSLSMPFLIGAVYLLAKLAEGGFSYKKYLITALCGGIIFLGFKVKGSLVIILAAAVIYMIIKFKPKRAVFAALALVLGFVLLGGAFSVSFNRSGIITPSASERYRYPYTHWLMIGLKGYGHYNKADSEFTHSFPDIELKTAANLKRINSRIEEYGGKGMLSHLGRKAVWTWEDGTYYISHHIENAIHKNTLHSYVLQDGENHFGFYAYSCAFQLFLILMMIVSAFKAVKNPEPNFMTFLRIAVFGAFLFFLVWETRSRYLYNLTPLFIILATDGLGYIGDYLRRFECPRKNFNFLNF